MRKSSQEVTHGVFLSLSSPFALPVKSYNRENSLLSLTQPSPVSLNRVDGRHIECEVDQIDPGHILPPIIWISYDFV